MRRTTGGEIRPGLRWELVEHHYGARAAFLEIQRLYEARVQSLVKERGKPREELKLNAAETRELFDTFRIHEILRRWMEPLREAAHACFDDSDGESAEPYASKVSRIYHELSILKEEHLSVRNFPRDGSPREFARLFREVSQYYPQRLRRVRDLFSRAQKRLEELLPRFQDDPILGRSVWLFREELWGDTWKSGVMRFFANMVPDKGAPQGFLQVAQSFFRAGFFEPAAACAKHGIVAAAKDPNAAKDVVRELDRLVARAQTEQTALEEQTA